ncbi:SAM-dependent methyltransferase [Pirellulimonas nuda]|uniref:SAM-dependent methyltransferase n=1 Tax=Pirellulimonas nuda TaxID=2528009 RepID=UPI0018D2DB52|nr:class I SAM-dependent methyltransferase [Pirellulimonas nuda]
MATLVSVAAPAAEVAPRVRSCYDVLSLWPACGLSDFTDGKYAPGEPNSRRAYLAAQHRQAEYLLDQARVSAGSRLLDIGCGYGRVLKQARDRGARGVGVTISPQQADRCGRDGLDVRLLNYRDILSLPEAEWRGAYCAVIANGSLEHFVQPDQAARGETDAVLHEFFTTSRYALSSGGRLVTTAIHFVREGQYDPRDVMQSPDHWPHGSELYHCSSLQRSFGGWYPEPGQLERCAAGNFTLLREEDGTHDYLMTSEYWMRRVRRQLMLNPRAWWSAGGALAKWPRQSLQMLRCLLLDESWTKQFRSPAPTRLLRQTWRAV